ncbi:MAG: hypothetical protein JO248_07600 [Acidimicrobiia bacterium]|nr:hypothetical protein [Acidimicrobiia bacterium]
MSDDFDPLVPYGSHDRGPAERGLEPEPRAPVEPVAPAGASAGQGRSRGVGVALVAVLCLLSAAVGAGILLSTGLGGSSAPSAAPGTTIPGAPAQSGGPSRSADPDTGLLRGLVVQQGDVDATHQIVLIPGGNEVIGQTTLDLCNGNFPSESTRSARLQVIEGDAQAQGVLSTEAVLYQSPAATAKAFEELKHVARTCPPTVVPGVNGDPDTKTTFRPTPDGSWPKTPTVDRLAYDFDSIDQSGQSSHSVVVYLRRGRALLGVYFFMPDGPQPSVGGQTSIPGIVNFFAARLAALPPAAVNRTVPATTIS